MRHLRAGRAGISAVEVLILLMILAILFFVALPILLRSRILNHEAAAIETLRLIYKEQGNYQQTMGKVGTLGDLVLVKRLDPAILAGPVAGYKYHLEVAAGAAAPHEAPRADSGTWWVQAVPEVHGSTGDRSFFMDQTGVIREKDTGDGELHPPSETLGWGINKE